MVVVEMLKISCKAAYKEKKPATHRSSSWENTFDFNKNDDDDDEKHRKIIASKRITIVSDMKEEWHP